MLYTKYRISSSLIPHVCEKPQACLKIWEDNKGRQRRMDKKIMNIISISHFPASLPIHRIFSHVYSSSNSPLSALMKKISSIHGDSESKESACNSGDLGLIPASGRSPGEGNGYPLQYSCLRIPWTEDAGGLQSMGSQGVRHDWRTHSVHGSKEQII